MLRRLGEFTVRRRRIIMVATLVFVIAAGAIGGNVASLLSTGGFEDPGAESTLARVALEDVFHQGSPNIILLVTAKGGDVDDPAVVKAGAALTAELAKQKDIDQAVSYWTLGSPPPLASVKGDQAMVLARIAGSPGDNAIEERVAELSPRFTRSNELISVDVGGQAEVFRQVGDQIEEDLKKAEIISFPVTLILLMIVFGSVVAAGLPLAIGIFSIMGTFLILRILISFTDVSIYALNLTTAMGLGLAIDYALFIVSRFREELANGKDTEAAVIRTVQTAGKTVLFSAATVAASLAALLVFPLFFLRSFAYAGIAVVALAAVGAVLFLPAVLASLGPKVDKFKLFHRTARTSEQGFWHKLAMTVMRRPVSIGLAVMAVLIFLGAPFLNVVFALPDDRVMPESATSRRVHEAFRVNFNSNEANSLSVVATNAGGSDSITTEIDAYAIELSKVEGASRVDAVTGSYIGGVKVVDPNPASIRFASATSTWLSVVPSVEAQSPEGEQLVHDVRAVESPFEVSVAGPSAQLVDSKHSIFSRLPLALGIIATVTFIVLFLMFGSVLVPLKAVVLNLLSLSATFGAMVWIFQEGHLSGFLNFTPTGALDTTTPLLMFCVAFGLSMDYEVFLLSRIKEEHDRTGHSTESVAVGLEKTGGIVTAAAALLAVVFIAFSTSQITFIKLFGVGLALAVVMDATLIRGILVPAFMRLAGEANWWAPKWMKKIYDRFGISDAEPEDEANQSRDPIGPPATVTPN
jgi:RND superfamily putative drug exporter